MLAMDDSAGVATYSAFRGARLFAQGALRDVLGKIKTRLDCDDSDLLVFDNDTGAQVEFDLRGSLDEVLEREAPSEPTVTRGRPKLGVISREVSLLPRHWDWLEQHPKGISAALRLLVDEARKREPHKERARRARAAANRFMTAMAGNLAGYEEATRALFADDETRLKQLIQKWPKDVRTFVEQKAREACEAERRER